MSADMPISQIKSSRKNFVSQYFGSAYTVADDFAFMQKVNKNEVVKQKVTKTGGVVTIEMQCKDGEIITVSQDLI